MCFESLDSSDCGQLRSNNWKVSIPDREAHNGTTGPLSFFHTPNEVIK